MSPIHQAAMLTALLRKRKKPCPRCGRPKEPAARLCPYCGKKGPVTQTPPGQKGFFSLLRALFRPD